MQYGRSRRETIIAYRSDSLSARFLFLEPAGTRGCPSDRTSSTMRIPASSRSVNPSSCRTGTPRATAPATGSRARAPHPLLRATAGAFALALALTSCGGGGGGGSDASASNGPTISGSNQTGSYTLGSAEYKRLYGPGVYRQDSLGNTAVGIYKGQEQIVSDRFRATSTGHLEKVRIYWQTGDGYSSGNNGVMRLRLFPDDGSSQHLPNTSGTPLAEASFTPGGVTYGRSLFADINFNATQPMQAGQLYHLVIDNTDGSPAQNYISSNNAVTNDDNARPARWLAVSEWATLLGTRSPGSNAAFSWQDLVQTPLRGNRYVPVLQITTREGETQGASPMESGAVDPDRIFTLASGHPIRERFTPSANHQINALSVATAAKAAGSLHWRILQGDNELASGNIDAAQANYRTLDTDTAFKVAKSDWYDVNLPSPVTLQAGQTYDVEFEPQGSSQWVFSVTRNGSRNGFTWPVAFTESHAEHRQDGQWINASPWTRESSGRSDTNWPVVLHDAP